MVSIEDLVRSVEQYAKEMGQTPDDVAMVLFEYFVTEELRQAADELEELIFDDDISSVPSLN